ncbi:hypothetical protein BCR42DRAFT_430348 [Absidia repens]|uniref:Nucleosome assembly protein n=1 Tax=Absidia repens TaxID=90262 RepID=A0A1X2HHA6_9FUNG|nr:hypothetical protein BCR42DRAFT_430348 [Absidia repens]
MSDDKINESILALETKEDEIQKQVEVYHRKLMAPLWKERREIVKGIPNFWASAISSAPMFNIQLNEEDIEILEHLIDFDVEYDDARPEYRKVIAVFKENTLIKNETLTKEFTVDDDESKVISKSVIEYHDGKEPTEKPKSGDDEDDEYIVHFLQWFGDESITAGVVLTDEIFPAAIDYYNGEDSENEDDEDIELGSDSEDEE